jgi:hypothetical protein
MEKPAFLKKISTAIEKRHLAIVVLISLLHVGLAALPRLGRPLRLSGVPAAALRKYTVRSLGNGSLA